MSVVGIPTYSPEQLRRTRRATVGVAPADARDGLGWLRRGYLVASSCLPLGIRRMLLRAAGVELGKLVYGLTRCYFGAGKVEIGDGSYINMECWFEGAGRIVLGKNRMLDPRAMILPGVQIGAGAVIAAGALMTGDCEAGGVYAGVPATRIK